YRLQSSTADGSLYGIKRGNHAKYGDEKATFEVGICKRINKLTGLCGKAEAGTLRNCVGNLHYDAYDIKEINILASDVCVVTCRDGSSKSCIAK
ncbi:MAG: hypothetical protein M3R00_07460, partial [Pseudomonadota bacterium]|nr:hypothetical protein [Pseudomonadota bacterium]